MDTLIMERIPYPRIYFFTRASPSAFLRLSYIDHTVPIFKTLVDSEQLIQRVEDVVGSPFGMYVVGLFSNEYMHLPSAFWP